MTKREFDSNKKTLEPLNLGLNLFILVDMLAGLGSIIWLIWGAGAPGWKLLLTTIVLFFFIIFIYYVTCYKYFKEGAENELIDEYEDEVDEQPRQENNGLFRFN